MPIPSQISSPGRETPMFFWMLSMILKPESQESGQNPAGELSEPSNEEEIPCHNGIQS